MYAFKNNWGGGRNERDNLYTTNLKHWGRPYGQIAFGFNGFLIICNELKVG